MTILTPNITAELKANGKLAGSFIVPAHEPLATGERPAAAPPAQTDRPSQPGSIPEVAPPPLKVALIGTAPSSRMLAPFNDPSWQIWACSPGNMNTLPRVDIWFELHANLLWPEHESYGKPYLEWLKVQKFPVFMQNTSQVERATPYPMFEIVREFGRDFFTSSFTWMMALALKWGASEIALYGVDMASRDEYILQRPGFYFFRYIAEKRGVKVSAPHESDIMQPPPLYAYAEATPLGRKLAAREMEVKSRVQGFDQQIQQATHSKTYLQGAIEDIDYQRSIWGGAMDEIALLRAENEALKTTVAQLHAQPLMALPVPANDTAPVPRAKRKYTRRKKPEPEIIAAADPPPMEAPNG
jgi:hypothetical protein